MLEGSPFSDNSDGQGCSSSRSGSFFSGLIVIQANALQIKHEDTVVDQWFSIIN